MVTGEVVFFHDEKKYGFVKSDDEIGEQFFFHINNCYYRNIVKGDLVTFEVAKSFNKPGSLMAIDVRKI